MHVILSLIEWKTLSGQLSFGMMVGGIDFIMSLLELFLDFIFDSILLGRREEKHIQAAREEGEKKGYAEGYAAAKAKNSDVVEEASDPPSKSSNPPPSSSKILN